MTRSGLGVRSRPIYIPKIWLPVSTEMEKSILENGRAFTANALGHRRASHVDGRIRVRTKFWSGAISRGHVSVPETQDVLLKRTVASGA